MEIRLYIQMLLRGWWMIVLTTLAALVASLGVSYLTTPQYRAIARFIVTPSSGLETGNDVVQSLNTLDRVSIMSTYAEVMNSNRIYDDTLTFLQLRPTDLKDYTHEAVTLPDSSVLELSVTGPDPETTAKLANTIGYQTVDFTRNLNQVFDVNFLDVAEPPIVPIKPKPLRDAGLALALGLVGGAVLVILNDQLRIPLEVFRQRLRLDNVTGVYTNRYFSRIVEDELAKKPEVLSIGIVELSGLQDLIDTFPLAGLQRVLQKATDSLHKELRGNDVIGRWSDNSFIVMLPNTTGVAANRIFERIFQALCEPIKLELLDTTVNLDAHIGGAEYGNDISAQELFEKATSALEQARRDKDNPVYVWEFKNPFWTQK